jgi:hypothetical protein
MSMKRSLLLAIALAGALVTSLGVMVGLFEGATPQMNLATPSAKKIVYSKTSNAWPATSPVDYEATTLAEGTLSGDSKVNTSVNGTNFDRDVLSSYYFTGTNNTTATHDFIFYCGLTGVTSVMVSLAGITTGMEISYNTLPFGRRYLFEFCRFPRRLDFGSRYHP